MSHVTSIGMNTPMYATISVSLLVGLCGCGLNPNGMRPQTLHLVVLDWTGGYSPFWWGTLPPIDLAEFPLSWPWHGTLADVSGFREMVRAEIEVVLDGSGLHVTVEEGEQRPGVSVVHFSQVVNAGNEAMLGYAHFDICNMSEQDFSLIYAARLLDEGAFTVDEWTRMFANVAAHEIAHNLGFGHVNPADVPESEFVELMIGSQTSFQRVMRQRILVEQDICDIFNFGAVKSTTDPDDRPTWHCVVEVLE